jgi:hypothetical protein
MLFSVHTKRLKDLVDMSEPGTGVAELKMLSFQSACPPSNACSETCLVLLLTFQKGINRTSFIMRCDIFAISKILVLLQLPLWF